MMDRRRFVVSAVGATAGALAPKSSVLAKPCPPGLDGGTGPVCPSAGTRLFDAAESLGSGQSVQFTKNTTQNRWDIQWMTKPLYYDSARRELQYVGKPASSQSTSWSHYRYDEDSDTWTDLGVFHNSFGHNWTNALDPVTGDYYLWTDTGGNGYDNIFRYSRAQDSWSQIPLDIYRIGAMAYHPNLFGSGSRGIFFWEGSRYHCRNLSSNSWADIGPTTGSGTSGTTSNMANGTGDYVPGLDAVVCGALGAETGSSRWPIIKVEAGAGLASDAEAEGKVTYMGESPVRIHGSGTALHGKLCTHPSDPNRVLILEGNGASGSARVWDSVDGGGTWNLKPYSHPFAGMPSASSNSFMIGRCSEYGVIIGMSSDGDGGQTILWKPAD